MSMTEHYDKKIAEKKAQLKQETKQKEKAIQNKFSS